MTKELLTEVVLPPGPTDIGTATLVKTQSVTRGAMDTAFGRPDISWPRGLVAAFTFGEAAGTNSVTSDAGMRSITVPLRNGVHAKSTELGPFGPMLELSGKTMFALENDPGLLDLAQYGDQFTVLAMVKYKGTGIFCVGGVHREGSTQPSRLFALYGNASIYGGAFRVCPHCGAQDSHTPGYPYNVDYAASARMHGPLFGAADGYDVLRTIAGTYDGQQIRAYLDGLTDSYPSFTEPDGLQLTKSKNPYAIDKGLNRSATPKDFSIGAATNRTADGSLIAINEFTGSLAVFAVFHRALTPEEIMGVQMQLQRRLSKQLGVSQPFTWLDFNIRDANGTRPLSLLGLRGYEGTAGTPTHDLTTGNGWRLNGTSATSGRDFLFRSAETPGIVFFPTEKSFRASQVRRARILLNSSAMTAQVRFVMCVGGQWYATHQAVAMSKDGGTGTSWATAEQKILALGLEAGIWRKLTLSPGDATPVIMTNLMGDPQGSGSSFISVPGTGGAASGAPQPAGGSDADPFWRTTWTAASTDVSGGIIVSGDNPVTPGKSYSAGLPVRCSKNQTVILQVQFVNADGVVIGSRNGPTTQLTANAFGQVRTSYVATAPAGAVRARLFVRAAGDGVPWQNTDKLDVKKPMLVEGSYLPPTHFAGSQTVQIPSGLSLDAAATTESIPNGQVEAFGIYSEAGAGTHRVAEIALYDTAA